MTYRIVCSRDNALIQREEVVPLSGERILVDLKVIDYSELESMHMNISVNSITPDVEGGLLKSITMKFDETVVEEAKEEIKTEIEESAEQPIIEETIPSKPSISIQESKRERTLFKDRLYKHQREILDSLILKINELDDPKIYIEEHKQHVAVKYNVGRSRAWLVIKASGGRHLYLWLRVGSDFHDPKHITHPYDDSSLTHGNRRVELMDISNLNDVMDLIVQSLEYRRRNDYIEDYTKITRWKGRM